jgi:O-antigen/teichoic acid export membrane protein
MKSFAALRRLIYRKENKETLWSLATKGLAAVLFFGLNIYLGRVLGAARFGQWNYILSVLTIVSLISFFGVNNASRAFAARHRGLSSLPIILKRTLAIRLILSLVAALAVVILHQGLASVINRPELAPVFRLSGGFIFFTGLAQYFKQVFSGIHRLVFHFVVNLVEFGLKILLLVVAILWVGPAVFQGRFAEYLLGTHWIALALGALTGLIFWWSFVRQSGAAAQRPAPTWREILAYSLPLFVISLGFLALTEIDTVMLGLLATDTEVGYYAIGKQFANKLPQLALALALGTMPVFAQLDPGAIQSLMTRFQGILKTNSLLFIPIVLALIALSPLLIPVVYGAAFLPAVLPLQILSVWILMSSYNIFLNQFLDYQGLARRRAINFLLTIAATIGLNWLFIPALGAVGAALSTTLAYIPYVVLNSLQVKKVWAEALSEASTSPNET